VYRGRSLSDFLASGVKWTEFCQKVKHVRWLKPYIGSL